MVVPWRSCFLAIGMVLQIVFQMLHGGLIPTAYITQDSDLFSTWFDSGIVDLSCGTGPNVYFAFRYIGNGNSGFDGTYELDNIKITAN